MSNLTEQPDWAEGIYQFETSDPVQGGPDGIDNVPLKQLANRTGWLRRVLQFGRTTYTPDTGTKNSIVANLLPAVTELVDGMEANFRVAVTNDGACTLTPNGVAGSGIPKLPLYGGDHADLSAGDLPAGAQVRARLNTALNAKNGGAWVIQAISGGMARIVTPPAGDMSTRVATMAALFAATDGRQPVDVSGAAATTLTADQYGVAMLTLGGKLTASKDLIFPAQSGQWIIENTATGNFNITARVKDSAAAGVVLPTGSPVIVCSDGAAMKFASAGGQAGFRPVPITGVIGTTLTVLGGYTPGAVLLERNGALQQPGTAAAPDFIATNGTTIELTRAATADEQFNAYVFSTFSVANAVQKSGDAMGGPLALYAGSTAPTPDLGDNSQAVANTAWFKAEKASETNIGTLKVATQAQANAGADDATAVTPKKLRAGFAISLGTIGYIAFPTWLGGLIIQWGTIAASTGWGWTYPIAFPTACLCAIGTNGDTGPTFCSLYNNTKTSVFGNRWSTSGAGVNGSTSLLVVGY